MNFKLPWSGKDSHKDDPFWDFFIDTAPADLTNTVTELMRNLWSPFSRVGPPTIWEGRAAHIMGLVRTDVATPMANDEFTG